MTGKQTKIELGVGIFMVLGLVAITFIAIRLGDIGVLDDKSYQVIARFTSASGLRDGAYVEAAGVRIGNIASINFDTEQYYAVITMNIDDYVRISEDAIASVRTSGIIGDKFIQISQGGSDVFLSDGMEIIETEPAINLEELISKYIFEGDE
jgi:phospholipid/cholesterol/gamma-HCH transport system substrate-binding protein